MSRIEWDEEFYWDSPGDMFAFTTGGDFPPHMHVPVGILSFKGTELDRSVCACMRLRDQTGKVVAFGSELEVLPSPDDKDRPVDVYFTILFPGRGTLFFQTSKKNANLTSGIDGGMIFEPTVGPGEDGKSVILWGTGEFAGIQGSHYQTVHISHVTPDAPVGETHKSRAVETFHFSRPEKDALAFEASLAT
jgi:hypothetical protein